MIAVRGLTYRRGGRALVDAVELTANPGEVLALIGPNGAGKSTLLRLISGEITPDAGTITLGGRTLTTWRPDALARARAVLPQASTLEFPFLVHEVVALGRSPHRCGDGATIAWHALERVGLETLAERPYSVLSGGERQRVHFARILAQLWETEGAQPMACLLDEPVSALDPRHQHDVLDQARQLAARGIAVVVVLHDLALAGRYADSLALMADGRVTRNGPPDEVLDPSALEGTYGIPFLRLHDPSGGVHVIPRPAGNR